MQIAIKEIKSQNTWNKFVQGYSPNNYMASWQWADFNDLMGDKTLRLGIYQNQKLIGVSAATITKSKKGNFLLTQAGPLIRNDNKLAWNKLKIHLIEICEKNKLKFIRVRPLAENSEKKIKFLKSLGFVSAPVRAPAEITWLLKLGDSEEKILGNMRKTTRYLIKKAQKTGVKIIESQNPDDLKIFHKLEENTVAKHKFTPFSKRYVKNQFGVFAKTNDAKIYLANYKGKTISCAVITFFGDSAFYNHGASIESKIPASYAIQWEAIKEAKKRGKKYYNFWGGIAPEGKPNHKWAGITLFKTGFGGEKYQTIHAYDLPTSGFYKLIAMFEKVRYRLRGHSV